MGVRKMRGKRVTLAIAGGLLASFGAFAYSEYCRDIRAARARVSSGSNVLNTPCGPIEYAEAGNGPPVLVIHGAGGGFDQGLELAQPLIDAGFRVIAVSRFGYLHTPISAVASPETQADAHACVLDALKIGRVAVVGGSAGAPSAMQLCLRHSDRCSALVLLFPMAFAPDRALLISAEDDLYGTYPSARYTAAQISGARFVGYPTGGHLLLGHWTEASSEVVAFLQTIADPL